MGRFRRFPIEATRMLAQRPSLWESRRGPVGQMSFHHNAPRKESNRRAVHTSTVCNGPVLVRRIMSSPYESFGIALSDFSVNSFVARVGA